jgi:REP element-mobilizing transposase RayT
MGTLDYQQFSERHRPHIHTPGKTLFVTYRLAGSIPKATLRSYKAKKDWLEERLQQARKAAQSDDAPEAQEWLERVEEFQREWFIKFEEILHKADAGPQWMQDERVADKMAENLRRLDGEAYQLEAYCVMSNHVHTIFWPLLTEAELQEGRDEAGHLIFLSEHPGLARIMHSLKGRAARECNLLLSRTGQFWEHESFDHSIRQGKLRATIQYVLNNPVKAGLVKEWREWSWNYCRAELIEELQL